MCNFCATRITKQNCESNGCFQTGYPTTYQISRRGAVTLVKFWGQKRSIVYCPTAALTQRSLSNQATLCWSIAPLFSEMTEFCLQISPSNGKCDRTFSPAPKLAPLDEQQSHSFYTFQGNQPIFVRFSCIFVNN